MRELIKMIVVLTVLSAFSGGLLAAVRVGTKDKIEQQQLNFAKAPEIKRIFDGATNDPVADRFKMKVDGKEVNFFVAKFEGQADKIAFESFGKGFGGNIGLIIGIDTNDDKIVGVGVTTHSETPGLGSRAKTDPSFGAQFKGLSIDDAIAVKSDGGKIDAISGATITSKGVCLAATIGCGMYKKLKSQILEQSKAVSNGTSGGGEKEWQNQ
ncbi:MAG: RnfABCDGE type electron transport complex subunit G [Desulfobacterales bacterium]|nr:RnfABCDGE type electron transport complex subunit G [Desulfobacterales bacterium]